VYLFGNACKTTTKLEHNRQENKKIEKLNEKKIPQTVRIIISKGKNAEISFEKQFPLIFTTSDNLKRTISCKKLMLFENGRRTILDDVSTIQGMVNITSVEIVKFTLSGNSYKGRLHIYPDKNALILLELPVFDYIKGIITAETPKTFHPDYVAVHSIIAYTYFIYKYLYYKNQNTEYTPDISELEQKYLYKENFPYEDILKKTFGYVIVYNKKIFPPFYHSTCGGITDNATETFEDKRWENIKPLSGGIKCNYCLVSPYRRWLVTEDIQKFKKTFSIDCPKKLSIVPLSKTSFGNIIKIGFYCDNMLIKSLNAFSFRTKIGMNKLRSYKFTILENNDRFIFEGDGFGHRVGLCQYGANEMLKRGFSYKDVLKHYFPDTEVVKLSDIWHYISY
jgi:stage II sporulation protein D